MIPGRVLVTGGAGFVGSHIVDLLLAKGTEVGVVDDFSTGRAGNIAPSRRLSIHRGDITDHAQMKALMKDYDAVVHQAARVSVPESVKNPILTNRVNVEGTLSLLEAAANASVDRFVYASSCAVYGDARHCPVSEDAPPVPLSVYGASKLAGEKYCSAYAQSRGLRTVSLRYFNVYGPRQSTGQYAGVITIFANSVLRGVPPTIYGDGGQTRDFVHAKDVARANFLALTKGLKPGEVVNVGTGTPTSISDLSSVIKKLCNRESLPNRRARARAGDIRNSYADVRKAQAALGFKASTSLRRGLADYLSWLGESTVDRLSGPANRRRGKDDRFKATEALNP